MVHSTKSEFLIDKRHNGAKVSQRPEREERQEREQEREEREERGESQQRPIEFEHVLFLHVLFLRTEPHFANMCVAVFKLEHCMYRCDFGFACRVLIFNCNATMMRPAQYLWLHREAALHLLVSRFGFTLQRAAEIIDAAEYMHDPETGCVLYAIRVQ